MRGMVLLSLETLSPESPRRRGSGAHQRRVGRGSLAGGLAALLALACALPGLATAGTQVRITTNLGAFTLELDDERAPLTVASFLRYVREGHYTGTLFHRVVASFVIQGGGYTTDYAPKAVREPIPNESGNGLAILRGTVGLARMAAPHSGDAQFYVNVVDNAALDPLPSRWGYAVFGRVIDGMDVVDRISLAPTGAMGPLPAEAPQQSVVIEKVAVLDESESAGAPAKVPTAVPVPVAHSAPAAAPATPPGRAR